MQHLRASLAERPSPDASGTVQARVRFLAYHRIKPHVPPLVRAPVNSFEFHPGGILNAFAKPLAVCRQQRVFIVYGADYQGI